MFAFSQIIVRLTLILFPAAEEVGACEQSGVGRDSLPGADELPGEAVLTVTAHAAVWFQIPMDIIMADQSGTGTSGLRQRPQEGGENLAISFFFKI